MSAEQAEADDVKVEAVGVEEMVRQERMRSIFDARKSVRKQRTRAKNRLSLGEADRWSVIYRNALETYVREVEPLLHQTDKGRSLWAETDFGIMDVAPRFDDYDDHPKNGRIPTSQISHTDKPLEIRLQGVRSLFDMPSPYSAVYNVTFTSSGSWGRSARNKQVHVERYIPIQALDRMFSKTNHYLADIGFGIAVDEQQQNTKIDENLINEVEQWRRENL